MKVADIINEINKLSSVDKKRVLTHFKYLLTSFRDIRPVFQEVNENKAKNGLKTIKRQRYRCKNCQKTFTESTAMIENISFGIISINKGDDLYENYIYS